MPPELFTGSGEMFMEQISRLAASYTPEWRFNPHDPDMGTALACMFARVLEHSAGECGQVWKLWYREFMEAAGCRVKEAARARGYMVFGLVKPDMPEILLPKGRGVISVGEHGSVAMETEEDVFVSAASVGLSVSGAGWLFAFDRPINQGVISVLVSMDGQWEGPAPGLFWEYYGRRGWTFLGVRDGTGGLGHTGIVSFAATSDFVPMEQDGSPCWGVRLRAGEGGALPGRLPQVYMNAAPVRSVEQGVGGNIGPWTKNRLKRTAGFVSVIRNPGSFYGGREQEDWEDASHRTAAMLRHQFRAVTPGDYECLVRELCPDAQMVRCFTGLDSSGKRQWGAVTVVVLLKNFVEGQPYFFRLREDLSLYFQDRADSALTQRNGCGIVPPLLVHMDVRAVVCVRSHKDVMEVSSRSVRELERFLHPVEGGYDGRGWDMGMIPDHRQLKNCLQHVPGVFYVRQLTCLCFVEKNGGRQEMEWEQAALFPWSLPVPGKCAVDVEVG